MFHPKVCLEMKNGQILTSECDCEASDSGQCCHVSALLFCLLDLFAKKTLMVRKACTETVNMIFIINRGRSRTTMTSFWLFLTTYPPGLC